MKKKILPISLVATSYNEAENASKWVASIAAMKDSPSEIIIIDSESKDGTAAILKKEFQKYDLKASIVSIKCNIAEGRNIAINLSKKESIAITDFGVLFDRNWLSGIYHALQGAEWVAGMFNLSWKNSIQKAYAHLFNKTPEMLNEENFLPSSRSFGIKKSIFIKAGGYKTNLTLGEDTEFVLRLKREGYKYKVARDARVEWFPRTTVAALFKQHFQYSYWDGIVFQNSHRFIPLLFLITQMIALIGLCWSPSFLTGAIFLLLSILTYLKACKNVHRGCGRYLATIIEAYVYFVVILGDSLGFLTGLVARNIK